jgi:hypothetical protein
MKFLRTHVVTHWMFLLAMAICFAPFLGAQQIAVSPGIISTIAGVPGSTTVGSAASCSGAATTCSLYFGSGDYAQKAIMDAAGNIYFADRYFNVVRKLTPAIAPGTGANVYGSGTGYTMTTVAGSASPVACTVAANAAQGIESPAYGDGCAATSASLNIPYAVAINSAGTILFISDLTHAYIRAVNLSATTQTWGSLTLAPGNIYSVLGTGVRTAPADSESGSSVPTSDPVYGAHGISIDPSGNLIVSDYSADTVRKLTPLATGNTITTIVGGNTTSSASPIIVGSGSACTTTTAAYGSNPCGDGKSPLPATTPSTSAAVQISFPEYALGDALGNVYIADWSTDFRIRAVNTTGATETLFGVPIAAGTIGTIVGRGVSGATGDGGNAAENPTFPTSSATINQPNHLFLDAAGALYFPDVSTNEVRRVDPSGIITTVVGHYGITTNCSQATDSIGDGCPATAATLKVPTSTIMDAFGNLFIVDAGNNVVREVSATTSALNFGTQGIGTASTAQMLTIYNTGSNALVLSCLTISAGFSQSGGTCTATSNLAPGASCTIPVVFSPLSIGAVSGTVSVNSNATNLLTINLSGTGAVGSTTTALTISPNPANPGKNVTMTATVTGGSASPTGTVTLTIGSTTVGPINLVSSGTGTATAIYSTSTLPAGTYTVTATYSGSAGYSASSSAATTLTLTSTPPTSTTLTLSPTSPIYGQRVTLNATVSGTGTQTGIVTFTDGSVVLGVSPLSSGTATLSVATLPQGANSLVATYSGDAGNLTSTSSTVGASIVQGPTISFTPSIISTVAGNGLVGSTGDGSAATSATLNGTNGLALDASGNLYLADTGNSTIRVVNTQSSPITIAGVTIPAGAIKTVAGNGTSCTGAYSTCGDGGSATAAQLNGPVYLRLDAAGNIYIADTKNNALRVVNTQSQPITIAGTTIAPATIATVAGNGTACGTPTGTGACGDGGQAKASLLKTPRGTFVDAMGNIYIADNGDYRVRFINAATGIISTVAGSGVSCSSTTSACGDGGPATSATLGSMHGVFVDTKGQIYIADDTNERIRLVNTAGIMSTIAGSGVGGAPISGSPATSSPLYFPGDALVDGAGDLYIPLQSNTIVSVSPTGTLTVIAGTGTPSPLSSPVCTSSTVTATGNCYSGDGGSSLKAQLANPQSLAMDAAGNIYIADTGNNVVRKLSVGLSAASFANQTEGTLSAAQTIGVSNTGGQNLQFNQIAFPSGYQQATVGSDCTTAGTLSPAASCQLGIGFMPPNATSYTGNATVTTNSPLAIASTGSISLTGTGTYVAPTVQLTASLSFGNQPIGTASTAQTLTLTNTGTSQFPISSAGPTDTVNFSTTTTCAGVLAAGSTCIYSVTFKPTSAGAFTSGFTVTDSTDNVSASASLTGTGTASGVTLSPGSLNLGSQPINTTGTTQSITLTNSGQAPLNISNIALSGANASVFSQSSTCGTSVAVGASCTLSVTFTPTAVGTFTANLVLTDNAPDSPQTVSLTGMGVAQAPAISFKPASVAFGSVSLGTSSSPNVVQVQNLGTAVLNLGGIAITGSGYAQSNTCGAQLAPNASCSVSVVFTPATATASNGSLTFTDNAAGSPQTVPLSGTGTAPQAVVTPNPIAFGSQTTAVASSPLPVTLSNPGNVPLSVTSIAITGSNANLFTQTNNCGSTVQAGGSCTISIVFAPTSNGLVTANLSIADNAANSPQIVAITGTGTVPQPAVSLSSSLASFGPVPSGSGAAPQQIVLTNSGSASLTLLSIAVSGAGFGETNNCGTQLAVSATCSITVTFAPPQAGAATGTVTITDNAQGTTGATQSIALTGTGTAPSVSFNSSSINFGSAVPGAPSTSQTLVVTNSGNAPLLLSNFLLTGNTGTVFTLSTNCAGSLAIGSSCNVILTFNPQTALTYNATFSLVDNANNVAGSTQQVTLTGVGAYPGSFTLTPTSPSQRTVPAGDAALYTILVSPVGSSFNGPVTFTVTGAPAGTVVQFSPSSVVPGTTGASTNLLLEAPVAMAAPRSFRPTSTSMWAFLFPLPLLVLKRVRRKLGKVSAVAVWCLFVLGTLGMLSGCGSTQASSSSLTTYNLTVTGTSGTTQSSTTVNLIVQTH